MIEQHTDTLRSAISPSQWSSKIDVWKQTAFRFAQRIVWAMDNTQPDPSLLPDGYERIFHYHIRKTGGTSLNRSFLSLGGEDPRVVHWRMRRPLPVTRSGPFVYVMGDGRTLERGRYFYGWSHLPAWKHRLPPGTFTVTVLRDPVARVVSLYNYLIDPASDNGEPFPAGPKERAMAADGFTRFIDALPRPDLMRQLYTFSPSFSPTEAGDNVRTCEAWFMTEDFDAGLSDLGHRLALDLPGRWDRRSKPTTARAAASSLERLRELLRPEYQMLSELAADPVRRIGA